MDQLIPLFNRLSQVIERAAASAELHGDEGRLNRLTFELPTIVVIGAQSSGKSSVLEGLVGKDFLPRGKDIVTRRPLILQLNMLPGDSVEPDYAVFMHRQDVKYTDFQQVKREIELDTERVAGKGKAISKVPILLSVFSKSLLPLTMVDLPGITKIPVGDQPADIEQQIKSMILEYALRPHALLLAITPANTDLANSDALKLTRQVDPTGSRTIGVLTKIDLMDAGTNAVDTLMNKGAFSLQHGFVGLVMRSQQDIQRNVPIAEAIERERTFFKNSHNYKKVLTRCGVSNLAAELNKVLNLFHLLIKFKTVDPVAACKEGPPERPVYYKWTANVVSGRVTRLR